MYKDGQTFCLDLFISLLHKIGSCSTLYFLCCYANYLSRVKTNGSMYTAHLDFRGMQVFCVVLFSYQVICITTQKCKVEQVPILCNK